MDINSIMPQLSWACDALIPSDKELDMPSAVEAGVISQHLPRVLKVRPDLAPPFFEAIQRLPAQAPADPLAALIALGEGDFGLISRLIAGAYFIDSAVNSKLGYRGQEALPLDPDYEAILAVTEKVAERGPVYTSV
jgi:hypothetical protein